MHVDGAFGLWAAACPELAGEVTGAAAADSWATDAHKWLNTTYDCGIALVRDGETLRAAMQSEASYLPLGTARDPMQFTPSSSQRARGAEVWAVLAALGRDGVSTWSPAMSPWPGGSRPACQPGGWRCSMRCGSTRSWPHVLMPARPRR